MSPTREELLARVVSGENLFSLDDLATLLGIDDPSELQELAEAEGWDDGPGTPTELA